MISPERVEDKADLARSWEAIIAEAAVTSSDVEAAKAQIFQAYGDKDDFAFRQALVLAQAGDLKGVLAWIEAEDKLPEEKLQRAKYLVNIVDKVCSIESDQTGLIPGTASVLEKITSALEAHTTL